MKGLPHKGVKSLFSGNPIIYIEFFQEILTDFRGRLFKEDSTRHIFYLDNFITNIPQFNPIPYAPKNTDITLTSLILNPST